MCWHYKNIFKFNKILNILKIKKLWNLFLITGLATEYKQKAIYLHNGHYYLWSQMNALLFLRTTPPTT